MRFLTMLATKCKVCKKRSTCNYKRMVACALVELPPQHHADYAMDMKADCAAPMIRKRDLRDIYISENDYFDEKGNCNCELIVMDRILLQELVDKTTWVPVKKGLPDDRQVVLTIKNKHISILEYHADTKHWFETRGNWWWSYNMVDAWMPLPKPYLGSER